MSRAADGTPPEPDLNGPDHEDLHLWKLPRGRHGLSPAIVAKSQRERLLAAVVRVAVAEGYRASSVADILKEAGVGRESFYKHFKDKEACFIAANDVLVDALEARVLAAYEQPGLWPERVRRGLGETLEWLSANPKIAHVMMIEMGTVGPIAVSRFSETLRRFTVMLEDGQEPSENSPLLPNIASIAGGAVFSRVYEEVGLGNTADLPNLMPLLTFELLLPYIGEVAAGKERDAATAELSASP